MYSTLNQKLPQSNFVSGEAEVQRQRDDLSRMRSATALLSNGLERLHLLRT